MTMRVSLLKNKEREFYKQEMRPIQCHISANDISHGRKPQSIQ